VIGLAQGAQGDPQADLGVIVAPAPPGVPQTRRYAAEECPSAGRIVEDLAATTGGLDFCIDSEWSDTGRPIHTFRTFSPYKGAGLPTLQLSYPNTVLDAGDQPTGETYANGICALGPSGGTETHVERVTKAEDNCPRVWKTVNMRSVVDLAEFSQRAQSELDAACRDDSRVWVETRHVDGDGCAVEGVQPHDVKVGQCAILNLDTSNRMLCFDNAQMTVVQRDRYLGGLTGGDNRQILQMVQR